MLHHGGHRSGPCTGRVHDAATASFGECVQRLLVDDACGTEGRVFAVAVTRGQVGPEAEVVEKVKKAHARRAEGRLSHVRLRQSPLTFLLLLRVKPGRWEDVG